MTVNLTYFRYCRTNYR